jgi:hypothetical protein
LEGSKERLAVTKRDYRVTVLSLPDKTRHGGR